MNTMKLLVIAGSGTKGLQINHNVFTFCSLPVFCLFPQYHHFVYKVKPKKYTAMEGTPWFGILALIYSQSSFVFPSRPRMCIKSITKRKLQLPRRSNTQAVERKCPPQPNARTGQLVPIRTWPLGCVHKGKPFSGFQASDANTAWPRSSSSPP